MEFDYDIIERLFVLSPHALLVLVISFFLWALRLSGKVPGWLLPWLAMAMGATVYPQIAEIGKVSYNVPYPQMILHLWGAALGGMAVCFNQAFRKALERFGLPSGDTVIIVAKKENCDESKPQ